MPISRFVGYSFLALFFWTGCQIWNSCVAEERTALTPGAASHPMEDVALEPVGLENLKPAPPASPPIRPTSALPPMPPSSPASKPLVLSSTKIGIPLNRVGSSASIITRQQIRQMQATSLLDVLRQVPGVDIVQNGPPGSTSSIFIRGANSEHTLVLVDGIRLNDPISPGRSFNYLDQISPDAIEQVEVLRGPQGPLFGSDGMGGVINIVTRSGEGRPSLQAKIQAGSYGTLQEDINAGASTHDNKLRAFLHATRQDVRGFSAASQRYGNMERDGFHNTTLIGKLQLQPTGHLGLDAFSTYSRARMDLDNFGGLGGDDPNYTSNNRMFLIGGGSRLKLLDNRFEQITRVSWTDQQRDTRNDRDPAHLFDTERSQFNSHLFALDAINNFYLHPSNTLTMGLNLQHESGDARNAFNSQWGPFISEFPNRSATDIAFYAQDYISLRNTLFTTLSIRRDHHNRFGNYTTYRAATSLPIRKTGTTFKASYGTGFKAPTLYQLYSNFGDPGLNPETSLGWDAGVEQALFKNRLQLGATCFQNQIKNLIQFNSLFTYENIARARTQGIEAYAAAQPFKALQLRSSYTYTDTKDLTTGDPLLRRPRHKLSFNLNYQPHKKVNINLDVTHIGQRSDLDFPPFPLPPRNVKLAAFTLVNLAISYDVTQTLNLFARLVNLLDTPYELTKGYGTARFSAYGGLRLGL